MTLRGLYADWIKDESLQSYNEALAGLLLEGAEPQLMAAGLGDLIADNTALRLGAAKLDELLSSYGLRRRQIIGNQMLRERVREMTACWRGERQRRVA